MLGEVFFAIRDALGLDLGLFFGGGVGFPFLGAVGLIIGFQLDDFGFFGAGDLVEDEHGPAGEELSVGPDGLFGGAEGLDSAEEEAADEKAVDGEGEDESAGFLSNHEVAEAGDHPGEDDGEVTDGAEGFGGEGRG